MQTTDAQVRKLMEERNKHNIAVAAARSGMHRNTASKYLKLGQLPSQTKKPRTWRTREDPFEEDWPEMQAFLEAAPELEAKTLFEFLLVTKPEKYKEGQLRTFQRRVRNWRAECGPPKDVFFQQEHRPGEALQTDFTWANELKITIQGQTFEHLLCNVVLPYSNWQWVTVCRSESMVAIKRGVQEALFQLGRIPEYHQTDNSTAATHDLRTGKRGFNSEYESLMQHFGMEPRTIAVGQKHQNGDVEALNGSLKRRIHQHLLIRGSKDFDSVEEYEKFIHSVCRRANVLRQERLLKELAVMKELRVSRLVEYKREDVKVTRFSTVRLKGNTYSVPSRLIGETLQAHVYERKILLYYRGNLELEVERLLGKGKAQIYYRHIIDSLVRKPGAFARFKYQEELFPSTIFREAYDALHESLGERRASQDYVRLLALAAKTMECEVEAGIQLLLSENVLPRFDRVKELVGSDEIQWPTQQVLRVHLEVYDGLLAKLGGQQ